MDEKISAIEREISKQTSKIDEIETLLEKDFDNWTGREKNLYGAEEQEARKELREKRKALRRKEVQLTNAIFPNLLSYFL